MVMPNRRSRRWRRIVLFLVVGVLIAILVFRETGYLSLDLYVSHSTTKTEDRASTTRTWLNEQKLDLKSVALTLEVTTAIETVAAKTTTDVLRTMHIPGSGPGRGHLEVDLQRLDLGGCYWLPLYKRGRCDFAASYKLKAEGTGSSVTVDGQVRGHIDCTVTGACSAYKYRQIIGQQVARELEEKIRSQLVKE